MTDSRVRAMAMCTPIPWFAPVIRATWPPRGENITFFGGWTRSLVRKGNYLVGDSATELTACHQSVRVAPF